MMLVKQTIFGGTCMFIMLLLMSPRLGHAAEPAIAVSSENGPRELQIHESTRPLRASLIRRLPAVLSSVPLARPAVSTPRIVEQAIHYHDATSQGSGNQFAVAELPLTEKKTIRRVGMFEDALPPPPAEGVQLHLNETDVRLALEVLSRSHNLNIMVAPGVSGTVTANLEGLSVDQALHAVLKLCNLTAHREDNVIYVYSEAEYPKQDLQVAVFRLDYSASSDVMPVVSAMLSTVGQTFLTEVDSADNRHTQEAVVVTDTHWVIKRVESYIRQIDVPPPQVMIEAHVLQIRLEDGLRHGINYRQAIDYNSSSLELDIVGFADPTSSPSVFARIDGNKIDALLDFLKTTTDAKTLASPRIMVVNGQRARIQVGEQLGYKVLTITETAAVEEVKFLDVGVVLEVTPRISRDGRVLMRVKPEVSEGIINPDTLLPEEETSELESDVLLYSGQGVVIGGLIQERDTVTTQKLPYLGDLRFVGRLFQHRAVNKERSEIVITLMPRIIDAEGGMLESDVFDVMRAETPLFEGPLHRVPRPWLPQLYDAIDNPRPPFGLLCHQCGGDPCCCSSDKSTSVPLTKPLPPPTQDLLPPVPQVHVQ